MKSRTYFSLVDDRTRRLPLFLKGMGYLFDQKETIRSDGFSYYHLMHVASGRGVVKTEDSVITADPGAVILLFSGRPHHYYPGKEKWLINWVTFGGIGAAGLLDYLELKQEGLYRTSGFDPAQGYRDLFNRLDRGGPTEALDLARGVTDLLADLAREEGLSDLPRGDYRSPVEPVIKHMAAHYKGEMDLTGLADLMEVTPQHLCHLFKTHTGHSPMEYLSLFRISKAKALLLDHPEKQVKEVAYSCGFSDANYFHRIFKKETGKTPGQFRLNPS